MSTDILSTPRPVESDILKLDNVTKSFSGFVALKDVCLTVKSGEIYAVIGPNGAGKSTLFATCAAEIRSDSGTVSILGGTAAGAGPVGLVERGLSRAFQVARIYPSMSVHENIMIAVLGKQRQQKLSFTRRLLQFLAPRRTLNDLVVASATEAGLVAVLPLLAGEISHGDKKRLELAMALCMEPKILLLDEPTAGMSPSETASTVELLRQLHASRKLTMLITEHDLSVVYALSHRIAVLNHGEIIADGLPDEIRRNEQVAEVYFGKASES